MQETIVVTTCSINHLAQAKGLCDSVLHNNPGYKSIIGLVDKMEGRVDAGYYFPHELTEAHELNEPVFNQLCKQYDVFELNCALKVFFTLHVIKKYQPKKIIFLDSDILVFFSLEWIEKELEKNSILLTPHTLSPFEKDDKRPFEKEMLKNGVFNGGFFAVKNNMEGITFLEWWKERMIDQCFVKPKEGLFVDQKWLNLAPIFFPAAGWLRHPGCNTAYWNLHERTVSKREKQYYINNEPLLFFHYSGYSIELPNQISRHQDRVQMENNTVLKELFDLYFTTLIKNDHPRLLKYKCYYARQKGFFKK